MAAFGILGLLVLAVAVPLAYGAGCKPPFYMYGDICLNTVQHTEKTWSEANTACQGLNAGASLAIVDNYRTQAHLVALMEAETGDIYIGLKSTPTNPSFHWNDDFGQYLGSFTRWGVGQPDGYALLTGKDYCVVMDNSNRKRPGRWYDVPCTENHFYICSMPLDPDVIDYVPPVSPRCPGGDLWYGYANKGCFYLEFQSANFSTFEEAQQKCLDISEGEADLATVLDGYESALLEGIMYAREISSAWIGMSSTKGEFGWESGYPIEFTNWGTNEPSGQAGEGCVKAQVDADNWDDTTCLDPSAFFCRHDSPPLRPPTATPSPSFDCPTDGWEAFGSYCYHFATREADWGEANFRCMQQHGSSLASITSDAERSWVFTRAAVNQGGPSDDGKVWIGLTRIQSSNGEWGSFGFVDGEELDYVFWGNGEPNGYDASFPLVEICVAMSLSEAGAGAWSDEICQFNMFRYVCKLKQQSTYENTDCPGDTNTFNVLSGDYCYMPSTIAGVENAMHTWENAENFCRENYGHLISIHDEDEQTLARKLSYSFALSYWIGLRQDNGDGKYEWSDETAYNSNTFTKFPDKIPVDIAGEEDCAELLIWENGDWETSACGVNSPYICKRGMNASSPIGPLPGYPDTGTCPQDYFKLGNMCFYFRGVEQSGNKNWLDARDDCKAINNDGTLATISNPGQQALLTSIIKVLPMGTDLWIGLNGIGVHNQYHWTDGSPLKYTSWMELQPDNSVPIDSPNSQTCVVMMNNPDDPGTWNDVVCSISRAYLCQTPLGPYTADPPTFPGECSDSRFTPYFDTCLLLESTKIMSFDNAKADCTSMEANLLSPFDKYEVSFLTASLYTDGIPADAEAWIGMKRNPTTLVFEWIDEWPVIFTRWGPNEPNNNAGNCVVMTKDGYWAVRSCTMAKYYFCEYQTEQERPVMPEPRGGDCYPGYTEIPDTDYCVKFDTEQKMILYEEGDYFCARDYNGGRLPSIHSMAEDEFIRKEAKKVFTGTNAKIWLGMTRNAMGFNQWLDLSLMDYVNWITGEPSTEQPNSPGCVALELDGGWTDIGCDQQANFICKTPKLMMAPATTPKASSGDRPATGLSLVILLSMAAVLLTGH